jgi:hypothetical protein
MRRFSSALPTSARMVTKRKESPSSFAMSRTMPTAASSASSQPLVTAEPTMSGILAARAARSMIARSCR